MAPFSLNVAVDIGANVGPTSELCSLGLTTICRQQMVALGDIKCLISHILGNSIKPLIVQDHVDLLMAPGANLMGPLEDSLPLFAKSVDCAAMFLNWNIILL